MTNFTRSLLVVSAFALAPATGAFAQGTAATTTGSAGGQIAHETYPTNSAARHDPALTGKSVSKESSLPGSENPHVAGATGKTVVPGDSSTIASAKRGTISQKTNGALIDGGVGGK